ncbi:MAG TPA: mechanosensitive ion channel family protein [Longimicrobiales bacterium]|nr:mechanosensitive ion channel family protein [Longimicrobiales bacterium]
MAFSPFPSGFSPQAGQEARDSVISSITELGQRWFNMDPGVQIDLVKSLLLILIIMLIRGIALRVMRARVTDVRTRYSWRKTITYFSVVLAILLVGRIWFRGLHEIATFLGLVTAGLAIALKDPIVNLGGWLFIIWRRPFVVGDRIQIGGHAGDVIDQRVFQVILLEIGNWVDADQSTGRLIHIPNGLIFREPLANYTRGMQFIWNEIAVLLTFESNWKKAKEILMEVVERHARETVEEAEQQMLKASRQYMIFYSTLTPTVYTIVKESGVALTMRYLCHPRRRRGTAQAIWEDVLTQFAAHDDIDFAYPTVRYYYNAVEGKPGTLPAMPEGVARPGPG